MTGHPLDDLLEVLVQRLQLRTWAPIRAKVVAQGADGRLDLEISEELGLGKGMQGVELALVGVAAVKVAQGAEVLVEFVAGEQGLSSNKRVPVVRTILSGTILEAIITTTTAAKLLGPNVEIGSAGAAVKLAGGSKPVVRVGDVAAAGLVAGPNPVTGTVAVAPVGTVLA